MTLQQFIEQPEPAKPLIRALWLACQGRWDDAHSLVASMDSQEAAWLHAALHREEGDISNAGYWYRRAGRPAASGAVREELERMVAELGGTR